MLAQRSDREARLCLPARLVDTEPELAVGGNYQYRINGEHHLLNPDTVSKLQHAVRQNSYDTFQEFTHA